MNNITMLSLLSNLQNRFNKLEWDISEQEEFVTCIKINQSSDEGYFVSINAYKKLNFLSLEEVTAYNLKIDFRTSPLARSIIKRFNGDWDVVLKELENWLCDMSTAFSKIQPN